MDSVLKYNLAYDMYMTLPVYHKKESVDDYKSIGLLGCINIRGHWHP